MRYAAFVLIFCLAGCAASEPVTSWYEPAEQRTVYETKSINLGSIFESGGIASTPRVTMRGWTECSGRDCHPEKAWLLFSMNKSGEAPQDFELVSDQTVVRLRADTAQYEWEREGPRQSQSLHGEFVRVSLDIGALEEVAHAENVSGSIGIDDFSLSYKQRAPLRAFIEKAKQ